MAVEEGLPAARTGRPWLPASENRTGMADPLLATLSRVVSLVLSGARNHVNG